MWWIFVATSGLRKVRGGTGYFNCPHCAHRRQGTLYQMRACQYLYGFIPFGTGEAVGPESYVCSDCKHEFVGDGAYGYDFGEHWESPTWKCFKCEKEIPYERFDCPHCGYRLKLGGQGRFRDVRSMDRTTTPVPRPARRSFARASRSLLSASSHHARIRSAMTRPK